MIALKANEVPPSIGRSDDHVPIKFLLHYYASDTHFFENKTRQSSIATMPHQLQARPFQPSPSLAATGSTPRVRLYLKLHA